MTNEEAIKNLQDFTGWFKKNKPIYEALEMAIKALSQEPTDEMVHVETLRQVMWERDIAIGQLKELGYGFGQKIEPCDDNRLYIKVYADLEPQEKAEKLYQICEKEELLEVYKELGEYCDIEPCDDAISRQYLLDNCVVDKVTMPYVPISKIQEALSVRPQEPKWISVNERLPEDGAYLVTLEKIVGEPRIDIRSFAQDLNKVDEFDFPKQKWGWYDYDSEYGYWEDTGVIAWMPLPEPYKAESEK